MTEQRKRRWPIWLASFFLVLLAVSLLAVFHPKTPLPPQWNPTQPLVVAGPVTPITWWKLRRTEDHPVLCRAALAQVAPVRVMSPKWESGACQIPNRVAFAGTQSAPMDELETSCAIALRVAMWERHSLQPAAARILGTSLVGIGQIGSYNCRPMRTGNGGSTRMSTHATASAIDITGFLFADGRSLSLLADWDRGGDGARFLRAARDGACDWFVTSLSPDYNDLHADHFHLQSTGWGLCR